MSVAYWASGAVLNSYRTNSIITLTAGELILKMYDMALVALAAGDGKQGTRVLAELIEALDFEHGEIALGLFRLYRYCMEEIKMGEYGVPTRILRELREAWGEALALESKKSA